MTSETAVQAPKVLQSLEDYLTNTQGTLQSGEEMHVIDFALRVTIDQHGKPYFYIHPAYQSGNTVQFHFKGNTVEPF